MSIDKKEMLEVLENKNLKLAEMEDELTEKELVESREYAEIKKDIKRLARGIADLEVQDKVKMQSEVNSMMLEYSQKKDDPRNFALCSSLKNKAATILYQNFENLIRTAGNYYNWCGTRQDYEDAVQTALLESFRKYDSIKNNNFCVWFYICLNYAVLNARKKDLKKISYKDENGKKRTEIMKKVDWPTKKDDEGNETPNDLPDWGEDVEDRVDHRLKYETYILKMSVCVVEIFNHRKDDKSEHYKYFPLFATDKYVKCAKNGLYHVISINERKAFEVMDAAFLNYVLLKPCQSLSDIAITPFKTYAQIDAENTIKGFMSISDRKTGQGYGERPTMISSPFNNVVFMAFLDMPDNNTSQTKISNQKKAFLKMIDMNVAELKSYNDF